MRDEPQNIDQGSLIGQPSPEPRPQRNDDLGKDNVGLALQFLVGLLSIGSDEASRRLQDMQHRIDHDPTLWRPGIPGRNSLRRQAWYMSLGLMKRGQWRLKQNLRNSYRLSLRAAERVSSASNRLGISRLARPIRQPLEARLAQWREKTSLIIQEGELVDQKGRALATGALATLIFEIMDEIAENPDMQDFVQSLIGQQGVSMATSIMDNARSVTLTADDASDALLRWLLRRTPRKELPPSPVEGKPQRMYEPIARVERSASDVG
jgi:hypothetical protein